MSSHESDQRSIHGNGVPMILLAEDEPSNRDILIEYLKLAGFKVVHAGDGVSALNLFKTYRDAIHLCLVDLNLPELDGLSLVREIRKYSEHVPVFILSGENGALEEIESAGMLNVNRLFQKPFDWETLLREIKDFLKDD